jgi:hypothetical protein
MLLVYEALSYCNEIGDTGAESFAGVLIRSCWIRLVSGVNGNILTGTSLRIS